jgi:uncharacterized repeat protein (TIGR01451 family)
MCGRFLGVLLLSFALTCPVLAQKRAWPSHGPEQRLPSSAYATDHVVVQFNAQAVAAFRGQPRLQALSKLASSLPLPAGSVLEETALSQWLRKRGPNRRGPGAAEEVDFSRFLYLRLPPGLTVPQCLARLRGHPWIDYVEPDGLGSGGEIIPDDPNFAQQWHHRNLAHPGADIRTPAAWEITTGSSHVIVAVLDTGLNVSLPEFEGRVVPGYDFVNQDDDPADDFGHGTAVTGTLAATANNGVLVAGVDWRCRIMPVKVLDAMNNGLYSWWAQGVDFAVSNGCKVINLSAGGSGSSTALTRAITNAIAQGVIFVTITHNDGVSLIRYPGNLPESITVGATDQQDRRAGFSNFGPEIDLVAPGVSIYTVSYVSGGTVWNGTSFAAPQVAGVCSLLAALRPGLTQEEARRFLTLGADDQVGDATDLPGFDDYYGYGRLNALNTLQLGTENLADLKVTLADSADPSPQDNLLTYTVRVLNQGPRPATGVVVSNLGPAGLNFVSATVSQGSFSVAGQTLVFEAGDLAVGAEARLEWTGLPVSTGWVTNQASVSADQEDAFPDNNVALEATLIKYVILPPEFIVQPESQTVVEGEDVTFNVNVSGTEPFGYAWQRSGEILVPFGQGGPTLILPHVQASNAGVYLVLVTNVATSAEGVSSQPASLVVLADTDQDGMPDLWETAHGFNPDDPSDAAGDADKDTVSNLDEFRAGTDPLDAESYLEVERITAGNDGVRLQFLAVSNKSYSVVYRDGERLGDWTKLADVGRAPSNRIETVRDDLPSAKVRIYRLVTPRQP